jgi:hypothetical protein
MKFVPFHLGAQLAHKVSKAALMVLILVESSNKVQWLFLPVFAEDKYILKSAFIVDIKACYRVFDIF